MQTDLIIVNEYCRICHIEPSFIFRLEEGGRCVILLLKEALLPGFQQKDKNFL